MKKVNKAKMGKEGIEWSVDFSRLTTKDYEAIAHKCECDVSYVSRILTGSRPHNSQTAKRIYQIAKFLLDQITRAETLLKQASIEQFDMD